VARGRRVGSVDRRGLLCSGTADADDSENGETFMQMTEIPFGVTDWATIEEIEHPGESGTSFWKTRDFGNIRVRMVRYSPGYQADHWCSKGHILLCLEGELNTETKDGRRHILTPGVSYQVADNDVPHRSSTKIGAKLFIVD
jgi:hypothetical protein